MHVVNDFINAVLAFLVAILGTFVLLLSKNGFGYSLNTLVINRSNKSKVLDKLHELGCFSARKIVKEHKEYIDGLILCGKKDVFAGYIVGALKNDDLVVNLFCRESLKDTIQRLQSCSQSQDTDEEEDRLLIFNRCGSSYGFLAYTKQEIDFKNRFIIDKSSQQKFIVDDIVKKYKDSINNPIHGKKRFTTVFIEGEPGSGKSSIGPIVAFLLKAPICKDFNPTDPGDSIGNLLEYVTISKEAPLVIVIDEADTLIHSAHNNLIPKHKNIPTTITNKKTLNKFHDDIEFYPNIILIETSNIPAHVIDSWDTSYLREGRFDALYKLQKN